MMNVGRLSYYIYLLSCVAALVAASGALDDPSGPTVWTITKALALFLVNLLTSPFATLYSVGQNFSGNVTRLTWILSGFLLAYLLMKITDRRMGTVFSRFWFEQQQNLRSALKQAREEAKAIPAAGASSLEHATRYTEKNP
jgi:hypothetical protein